MANKDVAPFSEGAQITPYKRYESVLEALRPLGGEVAFGCRRGHVASGRALRAATQ